MSTDKGIEIETHPFEPFIPENAKILIMGTFPPQPKRWAMEFYYPNRTNDFWFMMGLIFLRDKDALYDRSTKLFRLDKIKQLLNTKGIALNDTGHSVRRLMGNASDKYLEIVEPVDLKSLLAKMPDCQTLATTGEKAADTLALLTESVAPKMGEMTVSPSGLEIWRMPSTSRAYPLSLEKKSAYYEKMFHHTGII
ncbi:MAG: uracil-DNA glycosylase family protein [Muribaculaceae bacterium]|nr:uracil-DNA glycosylase family protein [Muribaculaceae bacterium]